MNKINADHLTDSISGYHLSKLASVPYLNES